MIGTNNTVSLLPLAWKQVKVVDLLESFAGCQVF